jgi:hypothetical protein
MLLLLGSSTSRGEPVFSTFNWRYHLGVPCPYAADPVGRVKTALSMSLAGQREAVMNIREAVELWAADRAGGVFRPLVLMFTGSTGLGKTDSALAVARALLAGEDWWGGPLTKPDGLVELSGIRFQKPRNLTLMREEFSSALAQALYDCHGHVVLLVDEIQKMDKRVLTELEPVMKSGGEARVYHAGYGGGLKPLDASRMVVLLVSDAGGQVLEGGNDGGVRGAKNRLKQNLIKALNQEFADSGILLGSLAQSIVPFLNFNGAEDVPEVLAQNLDFSRASWNFLRAPASLVDAMVVEPAVFTALASRAFVAYTSWSTSYNPENQTEPVRRQTAVCAEDMINLEKQQQQQGETRLGADGGQGAAQGGASPTLCGAPCAVPFSCVADRGARPIMSDNASPVLRLKRLLGASGKAGELLRNKLSASEARTRFMQSEEVRKCIEKGLKPELRVELRVSIACDLPGVRTPGLCTAAGLPDVGIRLQRCVVTTDCPYNQGCEVLFEGELPQ